MRSLLTAAHVAAPTSWARAISKARCVALFLFPVAMLLASGATSGRGQSALDGFDPNANGRIRVVFVQPDGKILIGGDFTRLSPNGGPAVTRNCMARLNPDGTLDTAFNPNANTAITSIALQTDGKIVVGGGFTSIGGQTRNRIARLDATTGQPDSFDPNANDAIYSVVIQADGKILAGGVFTSIGGQTRNHIARLDATTGLPDSFNPNANGVVITITLQADGKILVGGVFSQQAGAITIGGQARNYIARLDAATGLADSFNPNANSEVTSIAVQADGKILAGGYFQDLGLGAVSIGGEVRNRIARLDPTTGLADSFNPNANESVNSIAIQPNGKIVAGGFFTRMGGQTRNRMARLDPVSGAPDSFNPNGNYHVYAVALQTDGKILAGGDFATFAPNGGATVTRNRIARLETDGRVDETLDLSIGFAGDNGDVLVTVVQPDGKILIGGGFTSVLGVPRNNIARLNTDGTVDLDFNPNANSTILSIAVQADGQILVGGTFDGANSIGGQTRRFIARLNSTTGLADSFNPAASSYIYSIAMQTDGKILAGGAFTSIGGQTRSHIARLDAKTGLADSFDPNPNDTVSSIAVQADGKIVVGGGFATIGGQSRNNIARLDPTTGAADSFNPNASSGVSAIALQADGKILAGGTFEAIGGQPRFYIARLDGTTGSADSFNPNPSSFVYAIAVQADGKIIAGGQFISIGGQIRHRIARLDSTTGEADSFNPNADEAVIYSIAVAADGKLLVGGDFSSIGGEKRGDFARLSNDTAALQNLAVTQTTVTWTRGGSSPQFTRVTFEYSADNVDYTLLDNGIPQSGSNNWTLTGRSFPTRLNFYIRARGYYRSGIYNGSESMTESVRNAFLLPAAEAINLSSRMRVEPGDNVGIGGFIITGSAPKQVLLRAIGPSLTGAGVPDVLTDPVLELHGPAGFTTISNDNWRDTQSAAIQATGLAPTNDFESAVLVTLNPGAYTAIVKGRNNTSGVALAELYDLDQAAGSKLGNISTRAFVSTGADIVIAGFILGGNPPQAGNDNVLLRGIGPSLSGFGVTNPLADPTLELRNSNGGLLAYNNDWRDTNPPVPPGIAPGSPLESIIVATLPPGLYTALLAGRNNGTGVGVVEVYDRGAP